MSLTNPESTKTYEREAEATRERLSMSLDALATSLTPGTVLDEVLSYARAGGGDFLRGLGSAASSNPIPTLLIGLGAAMFLTGKGRIDSTGRSTNGHGKRVLRHAADAMRRQTNRPHFGSDLGEMAARERYGVGAVASGVGDGGLARARGPASPASGIGAAASKAASALGSAASGATSAVGSAASSTADAVGSTASTAASAVGSAASAAADAVGSTASYTVDRVRAGASVAGSVASGAAGAVLDTATAGIAAAGDLAARARGLVADAAGTVGESAVAIADSASDLAGTATATAAEQGQRLFDQTTRLTRDLTERTSRLVQEQPLAVAAAGLALGAALAAVLPRTQTEDSLLGETSDAIKDTVANAATEQFQRAKEATGRVVEEAKTAAEKEGLSVAAAADAVREVGEKVRHVVAAAGSEATKHADQAADDKSVFRDSA